MRLEAKPRIEATATRCYSNSYYPSETAVQRPLGAALSGTYHRQHRCAVPRHLSIIASTAALRRDT